MKILGLDLGPASIGWAVIEVNDQKEPVRILGMGCRIVPLSSDESTGFEKGKGESKCSIRTTARGMRRNTDRFQQRRDRVNTILVRLGMSYADDHLTRLSPMELWQLRADCADDSKHVTLAELGRVIMHINRKRGYRHSKSDNSNAKETEYVASVNGRYRSIKEYGLTVGQYFAGLMKASEVTSENGKRHVTYRIKNEVFPRAAYIEEFDKIMTLQSKRYPEILTPENIAELRREIFYQRPLKSCKHLVSLCEFESRDYVRSTDGKTVKGGPKTAPSSSPIAQAARLYETINNITLANTRNKSNKNKPDLSIFDQAESVPRDARMLMERYCFDNEERQRIFDFLNTHEKMSQKDLFSLVGLKNSDGFRPDQSLGKGIKGNSTYVRIKQALGDIPQAEDLLRFNLNFVEATNGRDANGATLPKVIAETGEIVRMLSPEVENEPLYQLWHVLYSIDDIDELKNALRKRFGITDEAALDRLAAIDFVKDGYSSRSAKFMRRLMPYLAEGLKYSEACETIGVNHSDSITKEENMQRQLKSCLPLLQKNALRQPIVEKILNQMTWVVNSVVDKWGDVDEVRVELARTLRQTREQREKRSKDIDRLEKENKNYADWYLEHGVTPSRNRLQKYRLWKEAGECCIYCGAPISAAELLDSMEIEHILPRSVFFDDSLANKACSCRKCNREKGNRTAYDFMASQPQADFDAYIARVETLYNNRAISKTKYQRLLTKGEEIPTDFLNRDLNATQYITRKACELLSEICREVNVTSGAVTDFLRHAWGYDMVIHDLNLARYDQAGLVEEETFEHAGQTHVRCRIKDWSKRMDHRHHAIDALTVALTRQGYIQRLNNLNSQSSEMKEETEDTGVKLKPGYHLLEEWAKTRPHFPVSQVSNKVADIAVSFKPGKKVAVNGKRYAYHHGRKELMQSGITVPRGPLHEQSVYGMIQILSPDRKISEAFLNPDMIVDPKIREKVNERIATFEGDLQAAIKSLKKSPLGLRTKEGLKHISKADMYRPAIVIKYEVGSLGIKDVDSIVDLRIREIVRERMNEFVDNGKSNSSKYQASLKERPIYSDTQQSNQIRTVRCFTSLDPDNLIAMRKDSSGRDIGYAKAGSNHHIAIYRDADGKYHESVVSLWTAVKRRRSGLPVVITDPKAASDSYLGMGDSPLVEEVGRTLPAPDWTFVISLQSNTMFLLGLSEKEIDEAVAHSDWPTLNSHLYRLCVISSNDYTFRLNTTTTTSKDKPEIKNGNVKRLNSVTSLLNLNPIEVNINHLGEYIFDRQ